MRRQTDARHCFSTESSFRGQCTSRLKYAFCFSTSIFLDITQVSSQSMTTRGQMRVPRKRSSCLCLKSTGEKYQKYLFMLFWFLEKLKCFCLKKSLKLGPKLLSFKFQYEQIVFLIAFPRWGQGGEETAGGQPGRRQGGRVSP